MKIVKHRLYSDSGRAYPYKASPNKSGSMTPRYIVMHYTAGPSASHAINWLVRRSAKASAHVVIGRDGRITQMVPFNTTAWHAGRSSWNGINGLNKHSIGIELANSGPLMRSNDHWVAWFGKKYTSDEVIEATHKNQTQVKGWHLYTPEQLYAALDLCEALMESYDLEDVVGHDDIAPLRKTDPGPAFPMSSFRSRLFGRPDVDEQESVFQTTASLNIRSGPSGSYKRLEGSPLPKGTKLTVLEEQGVWRQVDVLDEVNGMMDLEGWVHGRYIKKVS